MDAIVKSLLIGGFLAILFAGLVISVPTTFAITDNYSGNWLVPKEGNSVGFNYKVTVDVQTEENGNWTIGNEYAISFTISITSANQTYFDSQELHVDILHPEIFRDHELVYNANDTVLASANITHTGNFVVEYKPTGNLSELDLDEKNNADWDFLLLFKVYKNQQLIPSSVVDWYWETDHPITIALEEQTVLPPDYLTPTLYVGIGVIIVSILAGIYFIRNVRKSQMTDKQEQKSEC